jgi:hypothetical protein
MGHHIPPLVAPRIASPRYVSEIEGDQPLTGELAYPGHGGMPQVQGGHRPRSPGWERLIRDQPLGKRSNLQFVSGDSNILRGPPFFQLTGDDRDAMPLTLTIVPPRVAFGIPANVIESAGGAVQNVGGAQNNFEVSTEGDFPGTSVPVTWPPMSARVRWGVGGMNTYADVDLMNGVVLNLHASFVEVYPYVALTSANGIEGTSAVYELGAFIAPGYTKPGNAQKTEWIGVINAGVEGLTFPIPMFAKRAYLVACDSTAAPQLSVGTLRFWQNTVAAAGAGVSNLGNFFFAGATQFQSVEIPNGAMYFSVLSGMSENARYAVIFDLSI